MDYIGNVIRPPSEANSLILQVTVGCSHNRCTFCGTYKDQAFRLKDMSVVKRDIDEAASYPFQYRKAFFADGDVLVLPTKTILELIDYTKTKFPSIGRFGVYGNTKSILKKSLTELKELRDAGLGIVYQGIESGNKQVLRKIKKGAFPHRMIETAAKIIDAEILLSQTVLLGIGGVELSREHAVDTGKLLSQMSPDYVGALTVMILPGTELERQHLEGVFKLPDKFGLLEELKLIIENMDMKRKCFFASNHASNYLPVKATLPDDKAELLKAFERILKDKDEKILKPEFMRAL
ncbi:MAG: radical SAM protein [Proteobacteria bacterium]|nr:radical SAM protein [Pseudomonadota bacterium]